MRRYSNSLTLSADSFSSKLYFSVNSYSVMNSPKFLSWRHSNYIKLSDIDYESDNRQLFKENLGQANFHIINDDVIWACWAVEYGEVIFLIFSSNKATKYEVVYPHSMNKFATDIKMNSVIINFHYWLLRNIFDINLCDVN